MAKYDGSIELEGLKELLAGMDLSKLEVRKAAMKGLSKGAMNIIADAKDNLRSNESVVTGMLRASGKVQKVDETTLDVGFFSKGQKGYAEWVEYGRRAGKMPPVDEILQWLRKKHSHKVQALNAIKAAAVFARTTYEKLLSSTAWAIARDIARHGTQPHPFLAPAFEKNKNKIIKSIENELSNL